MKAFLLIVTAVLPAFIFSQSGGTINGQTDNLSIKLYSIQASGVKVETDGARAKFAAGYCACVDGNDAPKFMGSGIENISLIRDGADLTIEARPYVTTTDTLFINMVGMNIGGSYQFFLTPTGFDASIGLCKLVDHFSNTETPISLTDTMSIPFDVTAVAGSDASDRFSIVLISTTTLATNSLNINAKKQNNLISLNWLAVNENIVKEYVIEKSSDGINFESITTITALHNSVNQQYHFNDNNPFEGMNYYRIKLIQFNNNKVFSAVTKINFSNINNCITVYPNPVKNSTINVQMKNMHLGEYTVKLYNYYGQIVFENSVAYNVNTENIKLQFKQDLTTGIYQLQLTNANGNTYLQTIIVAK